MRAKETNHRLKVKVGFKPLFKTYSLGILVVVMLAAFFRLAYFQERILLWGDASRDLLVIRQAWQLKRLPLVGPFTSTGPFVFGPLFYWLLMLSYLPKLNFFMAPWVMKALSSILFVLVLIKIGELLGGKKLALVLGLLAAISPIQTAEALALSQHPFISLWAGLALLTVILYLKTGRIIYLLGLGLSIGTAINFHYQALQLLPYTLVILMKPPRPWKGGVSPPNRRGNSANTERSSLRLHLWSPRAICVSLLGKAKDARLDAVVIKKVSLRKFFQGLILISTGLLIPSLPLLIWDSGQQFANTNNLLDYFLIGQFRNFYSTRWLTYIFEFWTNFWARIIGGSQLVALVLMGGLAFLLIIKIVKRQLNQTWFLLFLVFGLQLISLRYYRGEKYEGYLNYFHPIVLLFTGWLIIHLIKLNKKVGLAILILISLVTINTSVNEIIKTRTKQFPKTKIAVDQLIKLFPGEKFRIYDYNNSANSFSYSLSLILKIEGLADQNGRAIGVCPSGCDDTDLLVSASGYKLRDLKGQIINPTVWYDASQETRYTTMIEWWKTEKLDSTFSLKKFLISKLKIN